MADLVLGLAKYVVEGVMTKAQAAIEKEDGLRRSAQSNLVFISGEFEMMHSFLEVANAERVENPVVKTWVRQIRELAYDVEDCIEFVVHLDKRTKFWLLVRRMVPSCGMVPPMPLDEAVGEIEQLKARVHEVSTRNTRYNLISDNGSKPIVVQQHQQPEAAVGATTSNMLAEARGATKRQKGFADLTRLIILENNSSRPAPADPFQVISVWGSGGDHGTTSIISNTYDHPEICKDQDFHRAWVKLLHPLSPRDFISSLMAQFYANSPSRQQNAATIGVHGLTNMQVFHDFERLVAKKRCLIVLEGLSNKADWDTIRTFLRRIKDGSRVIVSTQECEIATLCIGPSYQILELKKFSDHHSVCALLIKGSRDARIDELGNYLAKARVDSPAVMCVWGTDDVGKSALVRKLYDERRLQQQSDQKFDKYYWVDVSHPFNLTDPIEEKLLKDHQCLIVINDLRSKEEWDSMQAALAFKHSKSSSVIIVITTDQSIASHCTNDVELVFNVKAPEASAASDDLFKNKGSEGDGDKDKNNTRTLFGRDPQIKELGEYVSETRVNSPPVMSVWGIAGVGKSALVRKLYDERKLHSNNYDKYFWVDVSRPFNLRDLYLSLLQGIHSEKDPIEECHSLLTKHRCFVVIDELRSTKEWDLMQAALKPKKSKSVIIVITTDKRIATHCINNEKLLFNVKALEAAAASDLLNEVHKTSIQDDREKEVQGLILKCGGIPKVIAAIASSIEMMIKMNVLGSFKHKFMHHLETNPEYDMLQDLFDWIRAYFRDCPDYLKPCIFYLSIFPQGNIIRRRRLVRRWIAEGYSRDSHNESAEENGENHFSELLELSIIQQLASQSSSTSLNVDTDVRMVFCQVNTFIREYIVSQRREENLVFELGDKSALTTQRTGRHLVILKEWYRDKIVFERMDFSRLRSLTVFGEWRGFLISESMKLLRVLDLEDASRGVKHEDLDKVVKWLRRLKFLSLRGHDEIKYLPSSLHRMGQLQTLDIRETSIVTLPETITKLCNLQYIRAGRRQHHRQLFGVEVPRGIGKLTALHMLGVVDIGASGTKTMMKELKELTQLRKLGVSGINRKNIKKFVESIHGAHLESLSLQLDKDNQGCLDGISMPRAWVNLQSLKLYGLQDKLPQWKDQLSKLRKLDLEMATLKQNDNTEFLAKLPELCILRLCVEQLQDNKISFSAKMYGEEVPTYEKVKILEISCSSSSSLHVTFGSETMKNLELLKLDYSSGLSSYDLTGLNYLSELKEVLLKGTNEEALKTDLEQKLLNHPNKPVVNHR